MTMIAEGVETTAAACDLARKCHVDMPITEQMDAILQGRTSPRDAIRELMERSSEEPNRVNLCKPARGIAVVRIR